MMTAISNNKGFTLIELLVTMVLASMIMGGVYTAYLNQQKAYSVQEQVAAMQQNLRAAIFVMGRELRMAGFAQNGNRTLLDEAETDSDSIKFQIGDDVIAYYLHDALSDGDKELEREKNGTPDPVAENIDALNFVYLKDEDQDGDGELDLWDSINDNISKVKYIEVTIIARADKPDMDYRDTNTYQNSRGEIIFDVPPDKIHYRRRVLRTTIRLRNQNPVG